MASGAPRYVQIYNTLSRRMETGKYAVDTLLPTESKLCDEFNASRFTVREALRRMVEQGMVQRRKGAGSVVVSTTPQARYAQTLSSVSDLFQFALDTHYQLLSAEQVALGDEIAASLGAAPGERWRLLKGLRRREKGGKIFCYLHSYVAPRAGIYVRELANCVGPFYAYLAERSGEEILDVRQDIYGTPMTAEIAARLKCKAGTIAICALRRYVTKNGTLIASYNWHVAEEFYYRMKISRTT